MSESNDNIFKPSTAAMVKMIEKVLTKSMGRSWIQIQLRPPYIYLNLPISTAWSLTHL